MLHPPLKRFDTQRTQSAQSHAPPCAQAKNLTQGTQSPAPVLGSSEESHAENAEP